jgi:hypothetical protein
LKKLAALVESDGSAVLAAAKFNGLIARCRAATRKIGLPFENSKLRRKGMLAQCAAAERAVSF